jgi:hypothetical protein
VTLQLIITYMYIYSILYIYYFLLLCIYYLFNSIVHIIMICIYTHIDTTYNVYVAQTFSRTYYHPNFFPQLAGLDHDFCVSRNVTVGILGSSLGINGQTELTKWLQWNILSQSTDIWCELLIDRPLTVTWSPWEWSPLPRAYLAEISCPLVPCSS